MEMDAAAEYGGRSLVRACDSFVADASFDTLVDGKAVDAVQIASNLRPVLDNDGTLDADYLRVEEKVARDGIEIKRTFSYARDAKGVGCCGSAQQRHRSRRGIERT